MEYELEYKTVVLAGLLHDAGKFFQREQFGVLNISSINPEVSARFIEAFKDTFAAVCDVDLLITLIMKHHELTDPPMELKVASVPEETKPLIALIRQADNFSSSERSESTSADPQEQTRPLDSVFCRLDIGKDTPGMLGYEADVYAPDHCFPVAIKEQKDEDLSALRREFGREFAKLADHKPDFDTLYTGLYALLLKYAWCVPANIHEEIADVSLFDHLKTTCAIAASLYQYHKSDNSVNLESIGRDVEQRFLLVVGDISGIQNYIFSGASIGAGGIARKLRARSFLINMLSELTAQKIIKKLNLPQANIIMSSGGKFYILLPNINIAHVAISDTQKTLDRWLLDDYQGELCVNLAWQSLSGKDFNTFGFITEQVNRKLVQKKKMPFKDLLQEQGAWKEKEFTFDITDEKGLGLCHGCGREFAVKVVEETGYGKRCLKEIELGSLLPQVQLLEITTEKADISLGDGPGVRLKKGQGALDNKVKLTMILNGINLPYDRPALPKYLANHVPVKDGKVMLFDEIAARSNGVKRLALLKADVDHLGKLFAFGLKQEGCSDDSISRVSTFSRMLDLFFSGYVNMLLTDKFPKCYTVFSGGDDLVIIGPWNEIVDIALTLEADFCRFTGANPNLTLSAGIALARNRTPVSKIMNAAENLLERSKESIRAGSVVNRNQVSIFGKTLSWDGLRLTVDEGLKLAVWVNRKRMHKSELWRLKEYDRLYTSFLEEGKVEGLLYKAFLAYWIGRCKKERNADQDVLNWHRRLLENMDANLESLGPLVDYAYCTTREVD